MESSHGYSNNYLQWSSVTLTVTYTEGVSVPTVSSSSVNLSSAVTISTNRLTTSATHTLPFKVAYGSTSISGSSSVTINYSSAGFTSVPKVLVTYSTTSSNWSGDNGAIKVHSKTTTQASIVVGGSFNTSRNVDWLAIGT